MDFRNKGEDVHIDAATQSDEALLAAAFEIADVAAERGLDISFTVGALSVDAASEKEASLEQLRSELTEQLPQATRGYSAVVEVLNIVRIKVNNELPNNSEALPVKLNEWLTEDRLAYVARAMEADPSLSFTLVITPNIVIEVDELKLLADRFNNSRGYGVAFDKDLYNKYSPEEISGEVADPDNEVRFSLMPSKPDPELSTTVFRARDILYGRQRKHPTLHVPSPFENIVYWYTLSPVMIGQDTAVTRHEQETEDRPWRELSELRHFDMVVAEGMQVPRVYISQSGMGKLMSSSINGPVPSRVALG